MKFKHQLISCHLSQNEAAGLIGVSKRTIERWALNDNAPDLVTKALQGYKAKIEQLRTATTAKAKKPR